MEVRFKNTCFSHSYSGNLVLDNINLKIDTNKVTGIIGNMGSGKTTMVELILANKIPTKGKVIVGDITVSKRMKVADLNRLKSYVGYLPQEIEEPICCSDVKSQIKSQLEMLNLNIDDFDNRIIETLKMFGLDTSYLVRDPFTLSSGEMRKVALSTILIYNPSIIILDDPTIGLDMISKRNLINILTRMKKKEDKTIIVISSDIDFINKISDDVVVLKDGKVIKSENKREIFRDVDFFIENGMTVPKIIEFEDLVLREKGIRLGFRDEINDLVKDILRKY